MPLLDCSVVPSQLLLNHEADLLRHAGQGRVLEAGNDWLVPPVLVGHGRPVGGQGERDGHAEGPEETVAGRLSSLEDVAYTVERTA